jgi:cobalamin biosynthesis protein CbiG
MLAQSDPSRGAQPVTAREIDERHEEKLLALGPVLERTNDELLDPVVDRAYQMLDDAGLIPEAPDELQGVALKVEYISIMAQAQRLVGVVGQDRFIQTVLPLSQSFPEVRAKLDVFQIVDDYADMLGVDPRIVKSTDVAQQAVAAQAQQQQAMADAEQAKTLASALQAAGKTPLTGDTALSRLVQGAA